MDMMWDLDELMCNPLDVHQLTNESISCWKREESASEDMSLKIFVSSAKERAALKRRHNGKSITKRINKIGPR